MQVFLAGPFAHESVLPLLLGPDHAADGGRSFQLDGYRVQGEEDGPRTALVPLSGASAAGRLIECSTAEVVRIDYVMAAMGAAPETLAVGADAGGARVRIHDREPFQGEPVRAAASNEEWSGVFREFVAEIVDHFTAGLSGDDLAAILDGISIRALARSRGADRTPVCRHGAALAAADVERSPRRFAYARYFAVEEHRLRHRSFDGTWSRTIDRAVLASGDGVTVLPFDPRRDAVLLVEQFRIGAMARNDPRPWFLEAVAGRCDGLESPENAARRETHEESGVTLGRLERIATYYTTPGVCTEYLTAFVGEADLGGAGGIHGLAEEDEDIRALVMSLDAAMAAVEAGEINNAPLMLSLLWLARHHQRLVAAWR